MARKVSKRRRGGRKRLTKNRKQFRSYVRSQLAAGQTNDSFGKWRSAGPGEEDPYKKSLHGRSGGRVKSHFPELRRATPIPCAEANCGTIPAPENRYGYTQAKYCLRHR